MIVYRAGGLSQRGGCKGGNPLTPRPRPKADLAEPLTLYSQLTRFCDDRAIPYATAGREINRDPGFISRLRYRASVRPATVAKCEQWMLAERAFSRAKRILDI